MNKCRWLLPILILLLLQACSSPAPLPDDRYYDLRPKGLKPMKTAKKKAVHLVIRRPRADALRASRNMVYSRDGLEMRQYHHHFWADRPDRMLERALLDSLQQSGLFASVGSLPLQTGTNAELRGEILRLDRVRSGAGWKVDVALRFTYFPDRNGPPAFTRLYHQKLKTRDERMQTTIEAFDTVVGELLHALMLDLSRL